MAQLKLDGRLGFNLGPVAGLRDYLLSFQCDFDISTLSALSQTEMDIAP